MSDPERPDDLPPRRRDARARMQRHEYPDMEFERRGPDYPDMGFEDAPVRDDEDATDDQPEVRVTADHELPAEGREHHESVMDFVDHEHVLVRDNSERRHLLASGDRVDIETEVVEAYTSGEVEGHVDDIVSTRKESEAISEAISEDEWERRRKKAKRERKLRMTLDRGD